MTKVTKNPVKSLFWLIQPSLCAVLCAALLMPMAVYAAEYETYRVSRYETLSGILHKNHFRPLYSSDGAIAQTLVINPDLKRKGDLIYPNQTIFLPNRVGVLANSTPKEEPLPPAEEPAPAPEASVEPAPIEPMVPSREMAGFFSVGASLSLFKLDNIDRVTQDSASVLSNITPRLDLGYHMNWDRNTLSLLASLERYALSDFSANRAYDSNSGFRNGFGIQGSRRVLPTVELKLGVQASELLFLRSVNATILTLDKVRVFEPRIGLDWDIVAQDNMCVGVRGAFGLLAGASGPGYTISSGTSKEAGIYFNTHSLQKERSGIEVNVLFRGEDQDSSLYTKQGQEVRGGLNYFLKL